VKIFFEKNGIGWAMVLKDEVLPEANMSRMVFI
jgi:hypothetical protein